MGALVLCGRHCVLRHTDTQHPLPLLPASIASEPRRAPDFEMFLLSRQGKEKQLKFTVWVGNIYVTVKVVNEDILTIEPNPVEKNILQIKFEKLIFG